MSRQKEERVKICNLCYACVHDCIKVEPIEKCIHFEQGITRREYLKLIREENIDIKKLCNKYGVSVNIMYKMLNGSIHMSRKYRKVLDSRLFELEEYLPYVDKFNNNEECI